MATLRRVAVGVLLLTLSMNPATSQTNTTSQIASNPIVIELSVIAHDDIPSRGIHDPAPANGYPGWIENNKLLLHPEAARQIRWHQPGQSIFFSEDIKALEDARYVFVETISYTGTGRAGTFIRIFLSRTFPDFPSFAPLDKVFIGPLANRGRLMRIIPWPSAQWQMVKNDVLEVGSEADGKRIKPEEKFEFSEEFVEIPMRFVSHKPVPVGAASTPIQRQETDAGTGRFSAKVTVVFHGALEIEVAK